MASKINYTITVLVSKLVKNIYIGTYVYVCICVCYWFTVITTKIHVKLQHMYRITVHVKSYEKKSIEGA